MLKKQTANQTLAADVALCCGDIVLRVGVVVSSKTDGVVVVVDGDGETVATQPMLCQCPQRLLKPHAPTRWDGSFDGAKIPPLSCGLMGRSRGCAM